MRAPLAGIRQWGTSLDWAYETDPEPGSPTGRSPAHAGRMLGGTSAMNAMVWVKGSDLDYDGWRLPGWSWNDVAPVFARIEQGPMRDRPGAISRRTSRTASSPRPARQGWLPMTTSADPYSTARRSPPPRSTSGHRWSAARGYLNHQKNLTVITKAQVRRLIVRNGRAAVSSTAGADACTRRSPTARSS